MLRERCSIAEHKEEEANKRATDLRGEVEEVVALKVGREEDRRCVVNLEQKLGEL